REIQVAEAQARRLRERIAVLLIPALELILRRFVRGGDVLGEELHLLRHPALDDGVSLVESQRQPLAIENFLLYPVLDQTVQLFRSRVAPPLRLEQQHHLREVVVAQPDLFRRLAAGAAPTPSVDGEQEGAQENELNEWLA